MLKPKSSKKPLFPRAACRQTLLDRADEVIE